MKTPRILALFATTALIGGLAVSVDAAPRKKAAPAPAAAAAPAAAPEPEAPPAAPPLPPSAVAAAYTLFVAPTPAVDIVATLKAAGQFTTLLKGLDAAGLTPVLQKPGALTLFAPTDAAFAAVPAAALADLMKPENSAKLQKALAYHLINAKVTSDQVKGHAAGDVASVAGPKLHVDGLNGQVKVNDAVVIQADVAASNGEIHVIDKVLTPPM